MTAPARSVELEPDVHLDTGEACTVLLDTTDALAVGQTLRALARDPRTPHGTREILRRVGQQLVSAASLALAQRGGR